MCAIKAFKHGICADAIRQVLDTDHSDTDHSLLAALGQDIRST
jgi:hypothetical protein